MSLPHNAITPIPNNEPDAVPSLWNVRYQEIDENFSNLDSRTNAVESEIQAAKADKAVIPLPDGTDLNTLNLDGRYNGVSLVNAPDGDWYFIEVFRHYNFIAGSDEWLMQRATGMNGPNMGKTFVRNEYAPANWTAWQELADVSALAAKADVSALAAKADVSALAAKADVSALAGKADVSALAGKADKEVTYLPDGTDLNTLNLDGRYNGVSLVNAPDGDWYFIEVFRHYNFIAGSNEWLVQRATGMNGPNMGKTFVRNEYAPANWTAWQELATVAQAQQPLFHAQDRKPSGTNGGASVAGWQTRTLNTVLTNEIAGASLAGNIITLPAGTYYCEAGATTYSAGRNKLALKNNTSGAVLFVGENVRTPDWVMAIAPVSGRFTTATTLNINLNHYIELSRATEGLGINVNSGFVEIYADIKIWRIA